MSPICVLISTVVFLFLLLALYVMTRKVYSFNHRTLTAFSIFVNVPKRGVRSGYAYSTYCETG